MPVNLDVYTMSPVSPTHSTSWRNMFRVSSKKARANTHEPHLTLDTQHFMSTPDTSIAAFDSRPEPPAQLPLTPASINRYSYNSSDTHSSDSGTRRRQRLVAAPTETRSSSPSPSQTAAVSSHMVAASRTRSKSDKADKVKRLGRKPPQTASSSQQSFKVSHTPPRHGGGGGGGPLSPRSMSASASRFIRRVASAPNTKNLFSRDARYSPTSHGSKNGLLSPAEIVPPMPSTIPSSSEQEEHSLETLSSRSSRGPSRARAHTTQGKPLGTRDRPATDGPPGRAPFRRTYSSNSIKVGHVSDHFIF